MTFFIQLSGSFLSTSMGQLTQKSPSWQFWKCFNGLFHVPYNISQIKQICAHEDLSDAAFAAFIHSPMFSLNVAHSLHGLKGLSSFTAAWGSFGSAKRKLTLIDFQDSKSKDKCCLRFRNYEKQTDCNMCRSLARNVNKQGVAYPFYKGR